MLRATSGQIDRRQIASSLCSFVDAPLRTYVIQRSFSDCPYRSINNKLGPRLTLQLGTFGYSLYIGSFL